MRTREMPVTTRIDQLVERWKVRIGVLVSQAAAQIGATKWAFETTRDNYSLVLFSENVQSFELCARLTQNEALLREFKNCPTSNVICVFHSLGDVRHVTPMLRIEKGKIEFVLFGGERPHAHE